MDVGLRGNRAVLPQQFISQGDHTLRPGFEFWITGAANLWIPATAPSDSEIVINNATTNTLTITSNGGTPISGVARSSGTALPGGDRVRILPGQQASFVMGDRGWFAQGCEQNALVFTYNGTPLAGNPLNPGSASDLIHYLGGVGSYTNPATNGTITVATSSVFGSAGPGSVVTDRVSNPTNANQNWYPNNQANSWIAWQFPADFAPTGLLIQTSGTSGNPLHLRSFELRYSSDLSSSLTSSSPVSTWSQGTTWENQTQINTLGAWYFFSSPNMPVARRWAIRVTGPDSGGNNYPTIAEVNWFGDWFGV